MTEISVNIVGVSEIVAKFKESSIKTRSNIANAVSISLMQLVRDVKEVNLNGKYLKVNKGGLRTSVFSKESFTTNQIKGTVGTNAWYGKLWHNGWTRPDLTILPTKKKALFWKGAAYPVSRVNQKARTFEPRPYLTDALEARKDEITQRILRAVEF
jgi:hypothetical protein